MRRIATTVAVFWMTGLAIQAEPQWLTSLPQAIEQAKTENKSILLDFTGSDWCGWCKKLDHETFSQPEFAEFASQHLVLVQVDFPKQKPQSPELQEANKALQKKYGIHGYPTLVALAADGTVLWTQRGYLAGGPAALIAKFGQGGATKPVASGRAPEPVNLAAAFPGTPVVRKRGDEPRLQGIFYSSSHPLALLEGKNCEEGDSVNGMKVVKITRDKVTVEWKGQTKDLVMR